MRRKLLFIFVILLVLVSTIPSNAINYNKDKINIIDLGAKGDGITDDTRAIKAAMAAGNDIYIPPGTYMVEPDSIDFAGLVGGKFIGAGVGVTTFKALGQGTFVIGSTKSFNGWEIGNFTVDPNGFTIYGIMVTSSNNHFHDIRIAGWDPTQRIGKYGFGFIGDGPNRGNYYNLVERLLCGSSTGSFEYGLLLMGDTPNNMQRCNSNTFVGCVFLYNKIGVYLDHASGNNFFGCDFEGNIVGLSLNNNYSTCVTGGWFESNGTHVKANNASRISVLGPRVCGPDAIGFQPGGYDTIINGIKSSLPTSTIAGTLTATKKSGCNVLTTRHPEDSAPRIAIRSDDIVFGDGSNSPDVALGRRGPNILGVGGKNHLGVSGSWDSGHLVMGQYHLWVDQQSRLRIQYGAPRSDTDGAIVGQK